MPRDYRINKDFAGIMHDFPGTLVKREVYTPMITVMDDTLAPIRKVNISILLN